MMLMLRIEQTIIEFIGFYLLSDNSMLVKKSLSNVLASFAKKKNNNARDNKGMNILVQ